MTTTTPAAVTAETDRPTVRQRARRRYIILTSAVVAAVLGFGSYRILTATIESTDDAQVDADVTPISARVSSTVDRVHVADDARVNKGQLLIELSKTEFEVKLRGAQAALAAAKARAAAAKAQLQIVEASAKGGFSSAKAELGGSAVAVEEANEGVKSAQAALAKARSVERKARVDLERVKKLAAGGSVSKAELDAAESAHEVAESSVQQAEAQLAASRAAVRSAASLVGLARGHLTQSAPVDAQLATARAQIELAEADVKGQESNVQRAKLDLELTKIYAPLGGRLSRLAVREGQLVQPGQSLVVVVPDRTYVIANFKETQIGRMRPGQRAEVEVDAYPDQKLEGQIESIGAGTGARFSLLPPNNASGNFVKVVQRVPVRIVWVHPVNVSLPAGLSAVVHVDTR